ncbi:hypothetical protein M0804_005865 [Polistes exclamans]|nr:hypothetical protein M0804_005865 [Polistes exclamans]
MSEVLKAWFRKRLGVLIELTPELFGHYTRDGYLLAQILHSYGIINCDQLDTIIQTKDSTLCRVNLKHLRVWLRFIGVDCTDDCIGEISCGKGATSLQLFYKVYLSLEDKDSLYFITLQKGREKYIPSSRKFDVIPVLEEPIPYEISDHPLSKPLKKATSTIEWHRNKFQKILKSYRKEQKYEQTLKTKHPFDWIEPIPLSKTFCDTKNDDILKEMNDFANKHRIKSSKSDIYDPCLTDKLYDEIEVSEENPDAAKAYISWLKNRKRKDNIDNTIKSGMQNTLLSELWKTLIEKREKSFDELLARRVLDQSHYEKQIVTKLSEVLNQKNVMTENRRIVDQLMLDAKENKVRLEQERKREEYDWEYENVDMEYRRLSELHRKIRKEKLNKLREKHERICREVIEDLIDIALKVVEYRSSNECYVPKAIWNEWKTLFLKCQPIFDPFENEFPKKEEKEEEEEENIEEIVQSRLDREEVLNEANFESYHTLQSPWDEYVPPMTDPEIEEILKLGELVLGYIVHRLLEFVYPYPTGYLESPVPKVKTAAIILGIVEPRLYDSIEILLNNSGIRLVSMKDAINYCLLRYKEEMLDVEYIDANIIRATDDIVKRKVDDLKKNTTTKSKKTLKSDKVSVRRKVKEKEKEKGLEEKETQTPRVIPYDDMNPILSDAAYVGKWTYEFLILGQPISNELNTKIILEYLKSLGEIEGWALIDYPNSYDQMARLEFALTGCPIFQRDYDSTNVVNFDKINIEEIDPVSSRIIYEDDEIDDYSIYRQSF